MSDVFRAIADPKARELLEAIAKQPALTASKLTAASGMSAEQVSKLLGNLVEAGLVKSTGSGASKKYSVNPKGFGPYVSWLAKVAETQAVANLELQLIDLGEKLGNVIASGSSWVEQKVSENVDVDPKKWARDLGKILAEIKIEVQKEAKEVQKEARDIFADVKSRVKN